MTPYLVATLKSAAAALRPLAALKPLTIDGHWRTVLSERTVKGVVVERIELTSEDVIRACNALENIEAKLLGE
jgi:hypothetical protein